MRAWTKNTRTSWRCVLYFWYSVFPEKREMDYVAFWFHLPVRQRLPWNQERWSIPSRQPEWSRVMGVQRLGDNGGGRAIWDWQQEELWNSFSLASPTPLETSDFVHLVCHGVCGLNGNRGQWRSPSFLGRKMTFHLVLENTQYSPYKIFNQCH